MQILVLCNLALTEVLFKSFSMIHSVKMLYHPWLFKLNCNRYGRHYPPSVSEIQICKLFRLLIIIELIGQNRPFSSKDMMFLRSFKFSLISLWETRRFLSTSNSLTRKFNKSHTADCYVCKIYRTAKLIRYLDGF